jgi:hypothetical protein
MSFLMIAHTQLLFAMVGRVKYEGVLGRVVEVEEGPGDVYGCEDEVLTW